MDNPAELKCRLHSVFLPRQALLLIKMRFLRPRNGRGLVTKCPRQNPVSRPCPRPVRVRNRNQSVIVSSPRPQPQPRIVHVRESSAPAISPQSRSGHGHSASVFSPRPIRGHDARNPVKLQTATVSQTFREPPRANDSSRVHRAILPKSIPVVVASLLNLKSHIFIQRTRYPLSN